MPPPIGPQTPAPRPQTSAPATTGVGRQAPRRVEHQGLGWLVAPASVGAALRLLLARGQALGGDELHAVRVALSEPLRSILVTYRVADNCIPLTALYRLMLRFGPLSEASLRAPILLAGIALVAVAPLLVAGEVGRPVARLFAWWLACSPVLVLYSGVARPYLPTVLAGFAAVMAFHRWLETSSLRAASAYVGLAALAIYLHLGAAPFVLAPFGFAVLDRARPRARRPSLAAVCLLLVSLLAAVATFLVPAASSLRALIAVKQGAGAISRRSLTATAALVAGTRWEPLVALFGATVLVGLARLVATRPRFAAYTATLVAAQILGLWVSSPYHVEHPLAFNRYVMVALPVVLLWAAVGASPWQSTPSRVERALPYAFLAALVVLGPLDEARIWSTRFAFDSDTLAFFRPPPPTVRQEQIPAFYRTLLAEPPGTEIVEFPWVPVWSRSRIFRTYEGYHRHPARLSPADPLLADPRLRFRVMVAPTASAFLATPARYLVVHRDLFAEAADLPGAPKEPAAGRPFAASPATARRAGSAMIETLDAAWGPPAFADERLAVWDLDAARARTER